MLIEMYVLYDSISKIDAEKIKLWISVLTKTYSLFAVRSYWYYKDESNVFESVIILSEDFHSHMSIMRVLCSVLHGQ